jgi:hypothetical protein
MPHEFRNLHLMPQEVFTIIIVGGVASAAAIIGLYLYLAWKRKSQTKPPQKPGGHPQTRRDRGRKRRRQQ